ncbi:MAG: glycosyltransferase family 2 protein [Burkholderiales bacterium]
MNDTAAGRVPLTVTIIALNAANVLPRCLESVRWADEILVLDSGSSDDTAAIATRFGARVIQQSWLGFGAQKQKAVELASHDWIFSIDTDEYVSDALRSAIEVALRTRRSMVFAMPRCNRFLGRWLRHGEGYPDWSTRLFHRNHARWSDDTVHERILTSAPIARLNGDLLHESAESIESYLAKQDRYTTLAAHSISASRRSVSVLSMVGSPAVRFIRFYVVRRGFLDGVPGLIHITIGCWTSFMKYAKAWAIRQRTK